MLNLFAVGGQLISLLWSFFFSPLIVKESENSSELFQGKKRTLKKIIENDWVHFCLSCGYAYYTNIEIICA